MIFVGPTLRILSLIIPFIKTRRQDFNYDKGKEHRSNNPNNTNYIDTNDKNKSRNPAAEHRKKKVADQNEYDLQAEEREFDKYIEQISIILPVGL